MAPVDPPSPELNLFHNGAISQKFNGSVTRVPWRALTVKCRLARQWWRGLDSNQRTLARADLQSAAFNHSATSPGEGRRATWRRTIDVSTRGSALSCRPLLCLGRSMFSRLTDCLIFGAGEGNRTLVVSLEGFCSTIELHPLGLRPMPLRTRRRQPISRLTRHKRLRTTRIA